MTRAICWLAVMSWVGSHPGSSAGLAAAPPSRLATPLRERLGFTTGQLAALDRGEVVARTLDTGERREVAAFGAVRIATPREYFLSRYRDSIGYRRSTIVPEIGRFGEVPRLADLNGLTLDEVDVRSLEACRPGACKVHLTLEAIEALGRVDWKQQNAPEQAAAVFKAMLVNLVRAYLTAGNRALPVYADGREPIGVADELREISGDAPYLLAYVPELHSYLDRFPGEPLPSAENFLYWSKERYGLKPVISMTHVVVYPIPGHSIGQTVIASKQIYASHYFEATQTHMMLIDDGDARSSFYLAYLHRTRTASLDSFFRGLFRPTVNRRVRDGLERYLATVKTRLESGWKGELSNPEPSNREPSNREPAPSNPRTLEPAPSNP